MNINRDYLIINDVKKSNVALGNGSMFFYITDKNTQNIFVNLVINVSKNDLIQKYANIENAEDYTLTMNIVKPDNTYKVVEGKLHDKENAIFEFDLKEDCCDEIGTYKCELLTKCNINDHEEITTSNKLTYKVKSSILNDLDDIVEAPEYPLVIQLFDKLSDIDQYEEDRRANELARQLAEEQRQTRFDTLDANMTNSIQAIDDKVVEIENRITTKEQAVDKLINDTKADIDEYKVAKDQEIDEYKTAKDTEINNAITNQDNKIDTAISDQNDRITVVENNVVAQNDKLDTLETKATTHEARITVVEAKDTEQDSRLDIAENRLANIGNDITNTMQPIIDGHTSRLDAIEAINVAQNTRLDSIEVKNQQQDDRLLDIEKVNKKQEQDIKCLFNFHTVDITEEGNSVYLPNSAEGYCEIDNIQGNTLANCNKEPNKELILNGNINTSADNNVTLTEGVDGGLVDVALEGNTMVNVCDQKDPVAITSDTNTFTLKYLYTSTDYIIQFESDTKIVIDITLGGTTLSSQNIIVGINKINITTPSELIDNNLILNGEGFNASNIVVTQATDQDFGYFEGMKSVGECEDLEVVSSNKNLFDIDNVIMGAYISGGGGFGNRVSIETSPNRAYIIIKVKPNTSYILKSDNVLCYIRGMITDELEAGEIYRYTNSFPFHSSKNTNYYAINIKLSNDEELTLDMIRNSNLQIEEGDTSTDYIPHAHNTQTLTHEPLRAVGNTRDKYVQIDGKWYIERNCGEVVLDGSDDEDWRYVNTYGSANRFDIVNIFDLKVNSRLNVKCDKFPNIVIGTKNIEGISVHSSNKQLQIQTTKVDTNVNNFKSWLQANPVTVVYQIVSPTYEPIDYNPFTVYSDITHITNNSTIPCNMVIKNTGYNCLLKPSTTYTVSSNLGLNVVTTPSTLTEDCLRFMDTNTSDVTTMRDVLVLEGDWTTKADLIPANFSGIESAFEQEYDAEKGKYKVNIKVTNEDKTKENNITFYINEPLRGTDAAKDRVFIKDDKVVVERNCGIRVYEDGDFGTYVTDKVNTVYPLAAPVYEEVEYNDTKLFIESFKNSTLFYNSNVPVTSKLYYSYSIPIVDTVAQTANVTDQQDSMIIDLATSVAVMEMMLM